VSVVVPEPVPVAEQLHRLFDGAFAAPYSERREDLEPFLALRISSAPYALRALEIVGLATARKIVPLPSTLPAMLGLTAVRGRLLPVYGLDSLLGEEPANRPPRWLALCRGPDPVALAFAEIEGHLLLPRSEVFAAEGSASGRRHVRELVRAGAEVRGVIDVSSLVESIGECVRAQGPIKEG
jgi:chemotaxis signal transduction protein